MLSARTGFLAADLERNLDEPDLWALVTRWENVGSYRRALQGYESKVVVVPLLSEGSTSLGVRGPGRVEDGRDPVSAGENRWALALRVRGTRDLPEVRSIVSQSASGRIGEQTR